MVDQLAKPTFRSRYAHTPGPMDTVASRTVATSRVEFLV